MDKYFWTLAIDAAITAGARLLKWLVRRRIQKRAEAVIQELKSQRDKGELPAEWQSVDLEQITPQSLGIIVSRFEMFVVTTADFVADFWYVWIPLTILAAWFGS